jgi:hypothetical protein
MELTFFSMSHRFNDPEYCLSDGEKVVGIPINVADEWKADMQLAPPVFWHEVSEHMQRAWEFAFGTGQPIDIEYLAKCSMTKPTATTRWPNDSCHKGKWYGLVTPCRVVCHQCRAIYPAFEPYVLKSDREECTVCGQWHYTD